MRERDWVQVDLFSRSLNENASWVRVDLFFMGLKTRKRIKTWVGLFSRDSFFDLGVL